MKTKTVIMFIVILFLFITALQTLFALDETETAIITQFGEFVREVKEPGLHVKIPWIQTLYTVDSRVLSADGAPAEFMTSDRKRVLVDYVTRWRIVDPHEFYRRVRTESIAQARLDELVGAQLRQEVARRDFIDMIREDREIVMDTVAIAVREQALQLGIEVLDTRIKRTDLPEEVQESVFARMQAERHRIALRYRAEGEERANQIQADADRQATIILAEAYELSEGMRGEGDAAAANIYALNYSQDEEFYQFWKRLEVYVKIIGNGSDASIVLRTDSDLFKFLESANITNEIDND